MDIYVNVQCNYMYASLILQNAKTNCLKQWLVINGYSTLQLQIEQAARSTWKQCNILSISSSICSWNYSWVTMCHTSITYINHFRQQGTYIYSTQCASHTQHYPSCTCHVGCCLTLLACMYFDFMYICVLMHVVCFSFVFTWSY